MTMFSVVASGLLDSGHCLRISHIHRRLGGVITS